MKSLKKRSIHSKKIQKGQNLSMFGLLLTITGGISLIVLGVFGFYKMRYGVNPLDFFTVVKPSINQLVNGDRWYEGKQISNVIVVKSPTPSGKSSTIVKYTEYDAKAPEIKTNKTIYTTATVNKDGGRVANTTVQDDATGEVVVKRTTIDSMSPSRKNEDGSVTGGNITTSKTTDVRTDPITKQTDTYETLVSYTSSTEKGTGVICSVLNNCKDTVVEQRTTQTIKNGELVGETIVKNGEILKNTTPVVTSNTSTTPTTPSAVPPASTTSTGTNCDKGTCSTNGSPVCWGSYASTGQYLKDKPTEYECRLCGDNGSGGVQFMGSESCKKLLTENKPVVLGFDANPAGLGVSVAHTAPCFSKRGGDWVLAPVGSKGEGENENKYCDMSGNWVVKAPEIKLTPSGAVNRIKADVAVGKSSSTPLKPNKTALECAKEAAPGMVVTLASGEATNLIQGNVGVPGLVSTLIQGTINGVATVVDCTNSNDPKIAICRGGVDVDGNCIPVANDLNTGAEFKVAGNGIRLGVNNDGTINSPVAVNPNSILGGFGGCIVGGASAIMFGPIGMAAGCAAGVGAGVGISTLYPSSKTPDNLNTGFDIKLLGRGVSVGKTNGGESVNLVNEGSLDFPNGSTESNEGVFGSPDAPGVVNYDTVGQGVGFATGVVATGPLCTIPLVLGVPGLPLSALCRLGAGVMFAAGGNKVGDYFYQATHSDQ